MRNRAATKKIAKIVGVICVICSVAAFVFALSFYYRHLPNKPEPELGRIYPLNNHGYYTYMTGGEQLQQQVSEFLSIVLFALAVLINHFIDPFDRCKREEAVNKRPPWNHRWGP